MRPARSCCWPSSATGTPRLSPVGAAARHARRRRRAARDAAVVAVPWRREATPTSTTTSASRSSRTTPTATRSLGLADDATASCPRRSPRSSTRDRPPPDRAGAGALLHRPVRQRQVHAGPGADGPPARARRAARSPVSTATSYAGTCSAGLTFSKADRETNIRRIGWVAAEISRHGGVAVCSPIAPFDETRQQVRADGRRRRRRVLPRPRRDPPGGVRAARPQGALRQGATGRDPRVHRHLLALRGAATTPPSASTPPGAPSRTPWATCSTACARPATST